MTNNTFHIQWHITDNCNLRCTHCYQSYFSPENDLPLESLIYVFENISEFLKQKNRKLVIDLTGGEPLLHKYFWELLEYILNSRFLETLGIITNGFFLNDEVIYRIEKNMIKLKISSEGFEKKVYEFFRGKIFEKFLKICERLKEIKTEKYLMFTLLEKNWEQIYKVFDFAAKYKFDGVIIERFIPYGIGEKLKNEVISFEKWALITDFLHKICNIELEIKDIVEYKGYMVKLDNGEWNLYGSECIVGREGVAIMPNGDVFPCRRFPVSIGNLLNEKLSFIWENSNILNKIRDKGNLKGKCKNCSVSNCYGCRALCYSIFGDYLEEDPLCYLKLKGGG